VDVETGTGYRSGLFDANLMPTWVRHRVHLHCGLTLHNGSHVRIGVQSDRNAGVALEFLYHLEMDSPAKHERRRKITVPGGIPTAASRPVSREDLYPAHNIHLLVDAFPPGPQYHPRQPYMKEDDENA
jgi:hypothetical protein